MRREKIAGERVVFAYTDGRYGLCTREERRAIILENPSFPPARDPKRFASFPPLPSHIPSVLIRGRQSERWEKEQ